MLDYLLRVIIIWQYQPNIQKGIIQLEFRDSFILRRLIIYRQDFYYLFIIYWVDYWTLLIGHLDFLYYRRSCHYCLNLYGCSVRQSIIMDLHDFWLLYWFLSDENIFIFSASKFFSDLVCAVSKYWKFWGDVVRDTVRGDMCMHTFSLILLIVALGVKIFM